MQIEEITGGLQAFLARRSGRPARVHGLEPLAGGASREMYSFLLEESGGERRRLVLRMDPASGRIASDRKEEFLLLSIAREAGVTVPRAYWFGEKDEGLGARFVVMERVEGEAIARRLLRDDAYAETRRQLPADLARELARIHAIDVADARLEALRARAPAGEDPRRFALFELDRYRSLLDAADQGHARPALCYGERWLRTHAPAAARTSLVHGDFRIGNVMFDERGLTAVLDWELAHVGDPLEDIGWLTVRAWRFGHDDQAVGGLCGRQQLWRLYAEAAGTTLDEQALLWWEIFGNWKWAVICVLQAASHLAGRYPNVELASLGRRTAEVEWELLARIEAVDER